MRMALVVVLALYAIPAMARADTFKLANGDKVSGHVVARTPDTITLDNPVLGRIEIPVAKLAPEKPPRPGLFGTNLLKGWTRTLQLGMNGQTGNTVSNDFTSILDLDAEDEWRRWAVEAAYFYSSADHQASKNNGHLSVDRDWLFPGSRWFAFAGGRGDYDQFQSWEYRVQAKGGVGYDFLKTKRLAIRGRLGPSVTREFNPGQLFIEALVGIHASWKVNDKLSIQGDNTIYPAFNQLGEYRNVSSLSWKWQLAEHPLLSLNLGVRNEYQTDVAQGNRHDDFKYFGTVGLGF